MARDSTSAGEEGFGHRGGDADLLAGGGGDVGSLLNLRELDVGGHHHLRARVNGGLEGQKLLGHQLVMGALHQRQTRVTVHGGVAVAGEVLQSGQDAAVLQALHEGHAVFAHIPGIVPEGAHADDRVGGVVVHVHHRRKVHVDAGQGHVLAVDSRHLAGVFRVAGGREGHGPHAAGGVAQPGVKAALLIHSDEHRKAAARTVRRLHPGDQPQRLLRVLAILGEEQDAADNAACQMNPRIVLQPHAKFRRSFRPDHHNDHQKDSCQNGAGSVKNQRVNGLHTDTLGYKGSSPDRCGYKKQERIS